MQEPEFKKTKWHYQISLTVKTIIVTVAVGIAVWLVLDYIQSRRIKDIFMAQLTKRLGQQAMDDRIRFDRHVKAYHHSAKLFVIQKSFIDYVEDKKWTSGGNISIKYYEQFPPWFPSRPMLRVMGRPRCAILLDSKGIVREVFKRKEDKIPTSILQPSRLLLDKSHNQSYLTQIDGLPYLLASASYHNSHGMLIATLMLTTPIDDEFLNASIVASTHRDVVALLTPGDTPRVLTSSNLHKIPSGTSVESLKERYLITGKEFFDYGSSDLVVKFASFISIEKVNALTRSLVLKERGERAVLALMFITAFGAVMFWIAQRIQRITGRISDFSRNTLGMQSQTIKKGDQLHVLEERFYRLTEEVIRSREVIKKQAEEQTRLIVENAFDAIITMNADGITTTWNPQAELIFGWKAEETIGRKMSETIIPQRFRESYEKGLEGFLKTGKGQMLGRPFETTACHRDGHEFPVELTVSYTCTENGHIFIAIIRDISERKRTEEEAKAIQAKLIHTNKMTALGTLVSGIAHEINNPTSFIMSNAQLFSDIWRDVFRILHNYYQENGDFLIGDMSFSELRAQMPKLLGSISKGTERIKSIVDALKNFARADIVGLNEKVYVNEVVETAMLFLSSTVKKSTDNFSIEYGENIPPVKGNTQQLEQVVVNLVMNALQALEDRSRAVRVSTFYERETDYVVICVKDEGVGVPEDIIDRIIEPFFTTKIDKGGTGLGLSISHAIIKDHKGTMEFESKKGNGTTVLVKLPVFKDFDFRKEV
jgi:hypothetical protein